MKLRSRLINETRGSGILLPGSIIFGFLTGGLIVIQSYQLSKIISGVFLDHHSLADVLPLFGIVLAIILGRATFTFLSEFMAGRLAMVIKKRLRHQLLQKINRLGPAYLKRESSGELVTTALQGIDALDAYFSQYLPQILIAVVLPLTILFVVFPMDMLSAIILLVTAPFVPLFMVMIGKGSEALTKKQWLTMSRLGSYFLDSLQGIATLKMLGRSRDRGQEIRRVGDQYRVATMNVLRVSFLSALVLEWVATISTAVVAVEIGLRLLYGHLEFQQALFILLLAPEFYLPLRTLSTHYHSGMTGVTAATRIYSILDESEPVAEPALTKNELQREFNSDFVISLRDVQYVYPDQLEHSLSGININLERGKNYVLVGKSGSGKSTLAQILLRFIEPDSGRLLINGHPAESWSKADWLDFIGWVPQRPAMFHRSFLENITLGNRAYRKEEIERAVTYASLKDVVSSLPQGIYSDLLEGGARLSGGEAQRVALARAFLKDPQMLILDEPAAHLDLILDQKIKHSIKELMKGRTTITIAHRLSTMREADEIIVLDQGRVVDQGNHNELLLRCNYYAQLVLAGTEVG